MTEKYLPSNGTEGEGFFDGWCRQCAEQQPVEWRVDARYAGERRWSSYLHCRSQHEAEQMATIAAQANVETRIVPLYAAPVPQVAAGSGEQREPTEAQREPLSDEQIAEIQRAAYERAAQECDPHEDDDSIDRQIKRELAERILALGRQHD